MDVRTRDEELRIEWLGSRGQKVSGNVDKDSTVSWQDFSVRSDPHRKKFCIYQQSSLSHLECHRSTAQTQNRKQSGLFCTDNGMDMNGVTERSPSWWQQSVNLPLPPSVAQEWAFPTLGQSESESCSVVSDSLWTYGYTVHGILQARILECLAVPFSRGSS